MTGGTETGRDERKQLAARRVQQTDTSGWAAAGKKKELVDVEVTLHPNPNPNRTYSDSMLPLEKMTRDSEAKVLGVYMYSSGHIWA